MVRTIKVFGSAMFIGTGMVIAGSEGNFFPLANIAGIIILWIGMYIIQK